MGAGGTRVTNKQAVATTNLADAAVTSAKISNATIATADLASNSVTGAKISAATVANADLACPYNNITLWDGQISGLTTGRTYGLFTFPKDCWAVRVQCGTSGAYPTSGLANLKMHLHVLDAYTSSVASANLYVTATVPSTAQRVADSSAVLTTLAQSGAIGRLMCHYSGSGASTLYKTWVRVTAKSYNIA